MHAGCAARFFGNDSGKMALIAIDARWSTIRLHCNSPKVTDAVIGYFQMRIRDRLQVNEVSG